MSKSLDEFKELYAELEVGNVKFVKPYIVLRILKWFISNVAHLEELLADSFVIDDTDDDASQGSDLQEDSDDPLSDLRTGVVDADSDEPAMEEKSPALPVARPTPTTGSLRAITGVVASSAASSSVPSGEQLYRPLMPLPERLRALAPRR